MGILVSVIVNCHNGEKYLRKCISSIINQEYKNLEIIFYDNFSSDNSKNIIFEFNDKRIKYFFSDKKLSLYHARNNAIKNSSGEIIAFLDVDDWWASNYLSSRAKVFSDFSYDYFYSNRYTFFEKNNKFKKFKKFNLPNGKIYNFLAQDYFITMSGLMIRKKTFENVGYFNKKFNVIGDFDLVMKISKKFNAHPVDDPLVIYRYHQNNFSKLNIKMHFDEFNEWFKTQSELKDNFFLKNIWYFKKNLLSLEIKHLLINKSKNFYLLFKIFQYPDYFKKLIYLVAFFIPKALIIYLIK
jgi:glycosyltransferase involved in cell wall biosynthesis